MSSQSRPRVVVAGGGFVGLAAVQGLRDAPVDVTVIDRRNFHLFQPLLYQVATAGSTPSDVAWPIRSILRAQASARVVLGSVCGVDTDARALARLGVEVRCGSRVTLCDTRGGVANDQRVDAGTMLWAAGVAASGAAPWVGTPADAAGRARVQPDLSVPGWPEILVIGDTAAMTGADGASVPGIVPAAKHAGRYVATVIAAAVAGRASPPAFRYRHRGSLATIGRHEAVIDSGRIRLCGWLAWWVWGIAHIYFLIGMRNRVLIAAQWFFSYLTFGRGARLIAGAEEDGAGGQHRA